MLGKVTDGFPAMGAVISNARRHASEEELPLPTEAVDIIVPALGYLGAPASEPALPLESRGHIRMRRAE